MKRRHILKGFTLVELMVVLAIIGIIAGAGYPAYLQSIYKTNRVEGKTDLMDAAQRLQRCYTAYGSFIKSPDNNSCAVYTQLSGAGIVSQGSGFYRIEFDTAPTATAYTLKATAIKSPQTKDTPCVKMTLTNTGVKWPPSTQAKCW